MIEEAHLKRVKLGDRVLLHLLVMVVQLHLLLLVLLILLLVH